MKRISWFPIAVAVSATALGAWLVKYIMTPPPGDIIDDQGRTHVSREEVEKAVYKTNPPVSGPHLETWVKPGIYTDPQFKGELIHSLEHGYVVIHYNCAPGSAQPVASESAAPSGDCKDMVSALTSIVKSKKLFKLVLVPNPTIDVPIVLAAWDHLQKLSTVDIKAINAFIDYYRDHGPEQTME